MLLEVCANSFQSAVNANDAGAHRIELCQELSVGGITPSFGLIKEVISAIDIPVYVLIRPRAGNFVYSDAEFQIMKQDIQACKELGCHGIVSGILNSDNTIDIERTQELVELSKPLAFTFHRAFDEVEKPKAAIQQLMHLNIDRVLTSGQEASAEYGIELLKELHAIANDKIIILAGGGVSSNNVSKFQNLGLKEVHASASSTLTTEDSLFSVPLTFSDKEKIKAILNEI